MTIQKLDWLNYGTLFSILLLSILFQHILVWLGNKSRAAALIVLNILIISAVVYLQTIPIEAYMQFRPLMYSLLLMLCTTLPYANWGKIPSMYRVPAGMGSFLVYFYGNRLWFEFFDSLTTPLRELWIQRFNLFILLSCSATILFGIFLWVQAQIPPRTAAK